ncbi:MAG: siderophore interacting protein [Frankiales bacterium]|nr:siderophore interacting protein [Frankiales bacterium]
MHGTVLRVERLTPSMVRVVLGDPGLEGFSPGDWTDGYVNAQFLPAGADYDVPFDDEHVRTLPREQRPAARRYTVRRWDQARRELVLDVVVHGDEGVAGRWAQTAAPGDRLQLRGPSGGYAPDPAADWHLLVGDESALPAIAVAAERVPAGAVVRVVLEVDGPDAELPLACPGQLEVTWVHRRGDGAGQLLAAVASLVRPPGRVHAFVHGEAVATREVRALLLGEWAVPREDLSVSPYWRRTFTDERWREVKAQWLAEVERDV